MRAFLALVVLLGVLGAGATVVQMAFLSKIVDRVFLKGAGLTDVRSLLLLLLGAVLVRSALLWVREVVAQGGAVKIKSVLRERLFGHILCLGPAYAGGEAEHGEDLAADHAAYPNRDRTQVAYLLVGCLSQCSDSILSNCSATTSKATTVPRPDVGRGERYTRAVHLELLDHRPRHG